MAHATAMHSDPCCHALSPCCHALSPCNPRCTEWRRDHWAGHGGRRARGHEHQRHAHAGVCARVHVLVCGCADLRRSCHLLLAATSTSATLMQVCVLVRTCLCVGVLICAAAATLSWRPRAPAPRLVAGQSQLGLRHACMHVCACTHPTLTYSTKTEAPVHACQLFTRPYSAPISTRAGLSNWLHCSVRTQGAVCGCWCVGVGVWVWVLCCACFVNTT